MERLEITMLEMALKAACPALELRRNEPMNKHTSFRVGGAVSLMALPKNALEAELTVRAVATQFVKPFYLGNGSNLLVSDAGYSGLVLKTCGLSKMEQVGENVIRAESGVLLSRLARFTAERGLTGLEFASGIPGTVGGAVVMNAGAYGGEMAQTVTSVTYLDETGEKHTLFGKDCAFAYRHSIFSEHRDWLITEVTLTLTKGNTEEIKGKMAELATQRKAKQPLEYPSAGSTFKRPEPIDGKAVFAAALIDQCGLRGFSVGGAQVSEKHAGFVINRGGATCHDIVCLMERVRECVKERFGVTLEPEVRFLGDSD